MQCPCMRPSICLGLSTMFPLESSAGCAVAGALPSKAEQRGWGLTRIQKLRITVTGMQIQCEYDKFTMYFCHGLCGAPA